MTGRFFGLCFERVLDMNEIARIIWLAINGILILATAGIVVNNIVSNIKAAKDASEISEASSFMNAP